MAELPAEPGVAEPVALTPLPAAPSRLRLGTLFVAEMRLLVKGLPWWWYLVALGLIGASFLAPMANVRSQVLPAALIWPLLLWSGLGCRETRFATRQIVFSAPHPLAEPVAGSLAGGLRGGRPDGPGPCCEIPPGRRDGDFVLLGGRAAVHPLPGAGAGGLDRHQQSLRGGLRGVLVSGRVERCAGAGLFRSPRLRQLADLPASERRSCSCWPCWGGRGNCVAENPSHLARSELRSRRADLHSVMRTKGGT